MSASYSSDASVSTCTTVRNVGMLSSLLLGNRQQIRTTLPKLLPLTAHPPLATRAAFPGPRYSKTRDDLSTTYDVKRCESVERRAQYPISNSLANSQRAESAPQLLVTLEVSWCQP